MPTPRPKTSSRTVATRAMYARTNSNMLVGGVNPSDQPPAIWWMGSDSGGGLTPIGPNGPWVNSGPGLPVVIRATSLITGPLTSAPFRVLSDGTFGQPLPTPRFLSDPMLTRPDNRFVPEVQAEVVQLPRGQFWSSWIASAIHWGIGAFICQLDQDGQPLAGTLRNIDGRLLSTERDSNGALHWVLGADNSNTQAVFDRDGFITLGPVTYRLVVLRNPHSPVDAEGMSLGVFGLSPSAFKLAGQIDTYASGTFRSGIPAGYLKVDSSMNSMTETQAEELKASWLRNHGGDRRSIAVLNAFTSFTPLNLSPVDAALGEVKRLSIADVAMAFGLSPENLGVSLSGSATYANVRDHFQDLKDFGLAPYIAAVEDVLSALLPGTQGVKVNFDAFANPPLSERVATGKEAVEAGLMSVDEWRALEGLPPLGGSSPEQQRAIGQQEAVQKVYLGVTNGIITVPEARKMINDAGGNLDVNAIPEQPAALPAPTPIDAARSRPAALVR